MKHLNSFVASDLRVSAAWGCQQVPLGSGWRLHRSGCKERTPEPVKERDPADSGLDSGLCVWWQGWAESAPWRTTNIISCFYLFDLQREKNLYRSALVRFSVIRDTMWPVRKYVFLKFFGRQDENICFNSFSQEAGVHLQHPVGEARDTQDRSLVQHWAAILIQVLWS